MLLLALRAAAPASTPAACAACCCRLRAVRSVTGSAAAR
jgi:hypothetical protein